MKTKNFGNKKIKIEKLSKKDLSNIKQFQGFINSLIEEDAQIFLNKKFSLREERKWLKTQLNEIENNKKVFLVAQNNHNVVGTACVGLSMGRMSHIGNFEIAIIKKYRGIGLGTYLLMEATKLARKKLKTKFIRLSVFSSNKPAVMLYKKFGFKKVARIPKQVRYKGKLIDEIVMLKEL